MTLFGTSILASLLAAGPAPLDAPPQPEPAPVTPPDEGDATIPTEPAVTERQISFAVSEALVERVYDEQFSAPCEDLVRRVNAAAAAAAASANKGADLLEIPQSFPGIATTASPSSTHSSTAEKLSGAIELDSVGRATDAPAVAAALSAKPFALWLDTDAGKPKTRSYGNRVLSTLAVRIGTFSDLGVRVGAGVAPVLRRTPAANDEIHLSGKQLIEKFNADVASRCGALQRQDSKEAIRQALNDRKAAIEGACKKANAADFARSDIGPLCNGRPPRRNGEDEATQVEDVLTKLSTIENDLSLRKPLPAIDELPPDWLRKTSTDEANKRIRTNLWNFTEARLTVDGYADFAPLVYGFRRRDDAGEAERLPRGNPRGGGGALTLTVQRRGLTFNLFAGAARGLAADDTDGTKLGLPQFPLGFEVQCFLGGLTRDNPLSARRDGERKSRRMPCRRARDINLEALDDEGRVHVPYLALYLAAKATVGPREEWESLRLKTLREASATVALDFVVNDQLKFRLGVPVELALVQQEANAPTQPGPVVPRASGYQWRIPVFITTVLAM